MAAAPGLMWAALPRLAPNAWEELLRLHFEPQRRFDMPTRRAMAVWLRHMINMGLLSAQTLAHAMAAPCPFTELRCLYVQTCNRLTHQLEDIARAHVPGAGVEYCAGVEVALTDTGLDEDPCLVIRVSGYYPFSVSTLHRTPGDLARWVHQTFNLIGQCLVPCMLPADLWDLERYEDFATEEYEELRRIVATGGLKAAAAAVAGGDFEGFSSDPEELRGELERHHCRVYCKPPWMRGLQGQCPIRRAVRLQRAVHQYEIEFGEHPWSGFVREATTTLRAAFPTSDVYERQAHRERLHIAPMEDHDTCLSEAFLIDSGTFMEHVHGQTLTDDMANAGESATLRLKLTRIASARLSAILHALAHGLGLLSQAAAINSQLMRSIA